MVHYINDGYNAYRVDGAEFDGYLEIPVVKNQLTELPKDLIPYEKKHKVNDKTGVFLHFYMYDEKFIKIVNDPEKYLDELKDFDGIISPDCSLYWDMPLVLQMTSVYENRATAAYFQEQGINVIVNLRWGDPRSFDFCFLGLEKYGVYCISTHGCIKSKEEKEMFKLGLSETIKRLEPKRLLVHGSIPSEVFSDFPAELFVHYDSWISRVHQKKEVDNGN